MGERGNGGEKYRVHDAAGAGGVVLEVEGCFAVVDWGCSSDSDESCNGRE